MSGSTPLVAVPQGRVPPHNLDAERSLLGGLLLDGQAIDDVIQIVGADDFYRDAHRKTFAAMVKLCSQSIRIDHVSVIEALTGAGDLESVGGVEFIYLLDKFVPTAANLGYYAKIVHEKAAVRRTIEAAGAIAQLGYEQHGDAAQFLDEAQRRILAATDQAKSGSEPEEGKTIVARSFKRIERDYERQTEVTGMESGISELDRLTTGFQPADLVVLAARPSVGKTTTGLNWVRHAALRRGVPSLVLSMEMPKEALIDKILSAEARVDNNRIRTGKMVESDWAKMAQAAGTIAESSLYIDDEQNLSAMAIAAKARRVARKLADKGKRLGLIMVDYLTLMKKPPSKDTVSARVGEDVKSLKALAKELQVPLILLAQLNRESERSGKRVRPMMKDLRDSGEIEQHADLLVFVHEEDDHRHTLILGKQRNGAVGDIGISFTKELCRIDNLNSGPRHFTETGEAA